MIFDVDGEQVEADPREPRFLHTVRGRGYVLKPGV